MVQDINLGADHIRNLTESVSHAEDVIQLSTNSLRTLHRWMVDCDLFEAVVVWHFNTMEQAKDFAIIIKKPGIPDLGLHILKLVQKQHGLDLIQNKLLYNPVLDSRE